MMISDPQNRSSGSTNILCCKYNTFWAQLAFVINPYTHCKEPEAVIAPLIGLGRRAKNGSANISEEKGLESSTWIATNTDDKHEIVICNICNADRNINHRKWSERCLLIRRDHIKKIFEYGPRFIFVMEMVKDRTSSVPNSVLHVLVDKDQGLRSGKLFFTSLLLLPNEIVGESKKCLFEANPHCSSNMKYLRNWWHIQMLIN